MSCDTANRRDGKWSWAAICIEWGWDGQQASAGFQVLRSRAVGQQSEVADGKGHTGLE